MIAPKKQKKKYAHYYAYFATNLTTKNESISYHCP